MNLAPIYGRVPHVRWNTNFAYIADGLGDFPEFLVRGRSRWGKWDYSAGHFKSREEAIAYCRQHADLVISPEDREWDMEEEPCS
jgi:hypothetical protein